MLQEEKDEKIRQAAEEIMKISRNTLMVNLRFLDMPIGMLKQVPYDGTVAVDGRNIYYNPEYIAKKYLKSKNIVTRYYLHMILHCIFGHPFSFSGVDSRYWNLACDIAAENVIIGLDLPCAKAAVDAAVELEQINEIAELRKHVKFITAECLYRYFANGNLDEKKLEWLEKVFSADDHSGWYIPEPDAGPAGRDDGSDGQNGGSRKSRFGYSGTDGQMSDELGNAWMMISERIKTDLETFGKRYGDTSADLVQNLAEVTREKYDYTAFLKKFAVMGEVMKVNDDEFDNIFYTYGLETYGNIPLIEPLEYTDVKRIKDFVIAIDTSGSVHGPLVQKFIQKTYNILKSEETFFRRFNLHIIQCDTEIKEDAKITSQEEFDRYLKSMKLHGFGGTNFRPVFSYVDELIAKHEFTNLKGLIYFTDGEGLFPAKMPPYRTAFVFIDNGYNNYNVPPWAIKLILRPEEI